MMRRRRLSAEALESRLVLNTYYLHQGDLLQNTIHAASPGDVILLDAGATFTGPFTLEAKANPSNQPITIATNLFPLAPGVRVGPSNASSMAQILSPGSNLPAIATHPGANNYTLRGLNILPVNANAVVDTLVTIGDGSSNQTSTSLLPYNIILDQCFIHGYDGQGIKRGVGLNDGAPGSRTGVYNSYVSDFKLVGQDSQAVAGWNGTGPYTIQNNYLEASGEDVLFGGAFSFIQQVPSNITINNNTFSKQLSWKTTDPSYAGIHWSVKNLLELKNAQNVTIDRNLFQNNWGDAQDGHAILFTPRGDQSGGSFVTVSNVSFTHNTVRSVDQGVNILGSDDASASQVIANLLVQDNVFDNVGYPAGGDNGQIFTVEPGLNGGTHNLLIDHNTITEAYTDMLVGGAQPGFQFTNNVMPQGTYGIIVDGLGAGTGALLHAFPDGSIVGNVIVGGQAQYYPPGNYFPATWAQVSQYPPAGARNVGTTTVATFVVSVVTPSNTAGAATSFSVTAKDVHGNTVTGYSGRVHFGSGDLKAVLPPDTTLHSGTGTFSVTWKTAGTQWLTATDAATVYLTGSQTGITIKPAAASVLVVAGFPSSVTAGVATNFTVMAKDVYGNVATSYAGTVHFSSTDPQAVLPGNTPLSNGAGTFSATLKTAGTWSLSANDTVNGSLVGSQTGILVNPAAATHFVIDGPSSVTAASTFSITVKAVDAYGNIATGYLGTVSFSSSNSSDIPLLPSLYRFSASDRGVHTFTGLHLLGRGQHTITVFDLNNKNVQGSLNTTVT